MKVQFIGQSSFLFWFEDGTTLLTDPWFYRGRLLRTHPPALQPEQINRLDFLIASHNHIDHIDNASLSLARRLHTKVIGSLRVQQRAKKTGISRTWGLKVGQSYKRGSLFLTATPAEHPFASDAVGFLLSVDGKTIYFSGDTRPVPLLVSFLKPRKIDAMFVQIACAKYFGREDGMNINSAAALVKSVQPTIAVPMHYHGRFKEADPNSFKQKVEKAGVQAFVFQIGEKETLFSDVAST